MSDEEPDERDDSERDESRIEDRSRDVRLEDELRPLSDLVGELISVDAGAPPARPDDRGAETTGDARAGSARRSERNPARERTRGREGAPTGSWTETRLEDGEFVVTVDVPGASKDDLTVGINPKTDRLVIARDETVFERVALPWNEAEATRVWFGDDTLEVRLRPAES